MEKSHAFETVLILILIGLIGLLYFMISSAPQQAKGWEMQGNGSVDYMFTGSDDTLYVFQQGNVTAIKNNGRIAWSYRIPDGWSYDTHNRYGITLTVDEADGTLYLALTGPIQDEQDSADNAYGVKSVVRVASKLIALSPEGAISWEHQFVEGGYAFGNWDPVIDYLVPLHIDARSYGGRLFLSHDHQEDVLDSDGKLLFTIENITAPVAVDENGYIYAARTASIDAFDCDGKLRWSRDLGENITGTYYDYTHYPPAYRSLPLYANGTLYVPIENGTAALTTDGSIKWIRHLVRGSYVPFSALPVDSRGYAYLMIPNQPGGYTYVCSISPDGVINENAWKYGTDASVWPVARNDGTSYFITDNVPFPYAAFNSTLDAGSMPINTLTAYDMSRNLELWNFSAPSEDVRQVTLNASNVDTVMLMGFNRDFTLENNKVPGLFGSQPADSMEILPIQDHWITINPGKNVVYLSYYSVMYEAPIVFNRSRAVYVNSLYALDNNGTLLWKQPMDGYVTHTVARNDTFYYSTNGGKIGGSTVNVAAGIALIAAAYVFLRFFILGTVARARTRIESNRNRNDLLKFVNENPGVTAVDISKALKMNLGTTRYHLFILTANHKIVPHKEDGKFLRYFRNSGAYSPEERSWLSLMRREPIRRVLETLERNPGQSTQQLAHELDMSPTAVHNHISELSVRGIVDRTQGGDRGYSYMIKDEYRPFIVKTMEKL